MVMEAVAATTTRTAIDEESDENNNNKLEKNNGNTKHTISTATRMLSSIAENGPADDESNAQHQGAAVAAQVEENNAEQQPNDTNNNENNKPIKALYKSSRLKGYITLALASFINYDAARDSEKVREGTPAVPSTPEQRRYAEAVAVVSMILSIGSIVMHLDRLTPLQKFWMEIFKPGSKLECGLISFLVLWWSVGTGFATSVGGIAGDGKGQYNLYYSNWVCCFTSFWMLERWVVAAGWASLKSFISSWPNRSPAWICIMVSGIAALIWYMDLWQNHEPALDSKANVPVIRQSISEHFAGVSMGQWQWLIIITVFTILPAIVFVLIELFRETKADGSSVAKTRTETIIEGICFLALVLAWIPTVMIATTPGGAASLVGNAYFFTWLLTIFVFEGFIWFIHDKRKETHYALKEKEDEYRNQQMKVLANTLKIQQEYEDKLLRDVPDASSSRSRGGSKEFFDVTEDSPESRRRNP